MINRKGRTIKTALLVYALMILIVIGLRVKAEAQAPWDYGWGQGYYPAWGGSPYPFSGSFQGTYQWGSPRYSFGGLFQVAQYMNWGQRSFPLSTASYGWEWDYGQVNGYNATRQSSVLGTPPLPGQPVGSEFPGAVIVYGPPSWETTNYWETGSGYHSDPTMGPFDTSGIRFSDNEIISYSWETPWETQFRYGLISSPEPPQR